MSKVVVRVATMGNEHVAHAPQLRELSGRVAFITGGSSGIGLGIARACRAAGMKAVITYLTEEHLAGARAELGDPGSCFHAINADVRDPIAMQAAAKEATELFGAIHLICANAGVGVTTTIREATSSDWEDAIATNVLGVVNTISAFLPQITARGAGPAHIVATASMSGLFHGASAGVYTTTKYAVVGMMEALRAELRETNVGVSVFCPGFVRSRIYDQYRNRPASVRASKNEYCDLHDRQMRRMADGMDPLECGEKVLRGVRRNDMYILTHPEYREGLRERFQAVMYSFDPSDEHVPRARVTAERPVLSHQVYTDEIERRKTECSDSAGSRCG